MALSEQERRMLQEIEQALIAEDPNLAKQASGSETQGGLNIGIRSIAVALLGLCILFAGIALSQNSLWFVILAVAGFLVMFGGGLLAFRSSGPKKSEKNGGAPSGGKTGNGGNGGVAGRMEDSFRKRFE
ncbi:MAG: DUF3040 domain-containing protein [Mycobacteriaceae bacterium]